MNGRSERTGPTGVDDAALDREIESLLGAEPSPEFVARVRARVAEGPEPGQWWMSWVLAAGAVAVVIVAVMAWPSREPVSFVREPVQTARVEAVEPVVPPVVAAQTPARSQPSTPGRKSGVVAAATERRIDIDLPEVVIADNEVKTFAALVASLRQSRFDAPVPAAPDAVTRLEIKELPPVEPLEIEPIVKVAALQSEGERP